jgi:soluble lytic murein transglycosylase-like protein
MRYLFVSACMCLMTWSGQTGLDPTLSVENFSGISVVDKDKRADVAPSDFAASPAAEENPQPLDASWDSGASNLAQPTDTPIDIPAQAGVGQAIEPQPNLLALIVKPVVYRSRQEVCDTLAKAAQSNDLPVPFFIRLLFQESGFKPDVVSRAGAQGVAQFMPETAVDMGLDNPFDPLQAIPASARLLRNLIVQFGNLGLAAAAYNAGPKRIQAWLTKKGKLPQETQGYVKIITGRPVETWTAADARFPEMRIPRHAPCQETAGLHAWNGPDRIPVPRPSPFTFKSLVQLRIAVQTAASTAKLKQNAVRITANIRSEKTAKAPAVHGAKDTIQLAARKQPATKTKLDRQPSKMDRKTAGKPLELAMMSRSSGK